MTNNQHLSESEMHYKLMPLGFTSHQVKSLITAAVGRHKALKELKRFELKQLRRSIASRKAALARKTKRLTQLRKTTVKPNATRRNIAFLARWIEQKSAALLRAQHKQADLERQLKEGAFSLVFGGKKLLSQRPTEFNADTTPFAALEAWRDAWELARNHQVWSVGAKSKPQGNQEIQWDPATETLRIRLTDTQAELRMREMEAVHSVALVNGNPKTSALRMQCRFVEIPGVSFASRGEVANAALCRATQHAPVTMRLIRRAAPTGEPAFYLQASVDVADTPVQVTRAVGALGADFNKRGIAWCVVAPNGNKGETGFISWNTSGKTSEQRKAILSEAGTQLTAIAKKHCVALAIEDLDFTGKKAVMRAGAVNREYNAMLGALATAQFRELLTSKAAVAGIALHLVNPAYSSVGGFAKYGCINRIDADRAAALWIGRQALYGEVSEVTGVVHHTEEYQERLSLPHLPTSRKQSKKALAGATWQDLAQALGRNRRMWGEKLHAWCDGKVEIVLQNEEFDRVLETWHTDMGNVSQARANKPFVPAPLAA
jgi:IS605 OrfB family transposase